MGDGCSRVGLSRLLFPLCLPQGDRFIPNRPSMNFDLCNHMLLSSDNSENEPQPGADAPAPLRREFQQALRNTLLSPAGGGGGASKSERGGDGGSAAGGSPRVLSFAERPPPPEDRYTNVLKVGRTIRLLESRSVYVAPGGAAPCAGAGECCRCWHCSLVAFGGGVHTGIWCCAGWRTAGCSRFCGRTSSVPGGWGSLWVRNITVGAAGTPFHCFGRVVSGGWVGLPCR